MHIIDFSGFFVKGVVKNRGIRNNAIQSPPTIHSRKEPKKQFLGTIESQASTHENTAKHRKEPEKHPETTSSNPPSNTVALQ